MLIRKSNRNLLHDPVDRRAGIPAGWATASSDFDAETSASRATPEVNPIRTEQENVSRHGLSRRHHRRAPWTCVAAAAASVLVASLAPVPDLAAGGVGVPGEVTAIGSLPPWVSLTTPFHVAGYAVIGALVTRAACASSVDQRQHWEYRNDDEMGREATGPVDDATEPADGTAERTTAEATSITVAVVAGVFFAAAVGFGVELAQTTIPWRSFAWIDVGVNVVGAVTGAGGYAIRWTLSAAPR